jgi:hypothetical protein
MSPIAPTYCSALRKGGVFGQGHAWHPTTREGEPHCDGRCAQSGYFATVQDAKTTNDLKAPMPITDAGRFWITCRRRDLVRNIVPCPAPSPTLWHRLGVPS